MGPDSCSAAAATGGGLGGGGSEGEGGGAGKGGNEGNGGAGNSGESSGGPEKGFKLLPVVILVLIFLAKDMCEIMISFGSKNDDEKNEIQ